MREITNIVLIMALNKQGVKNIKVNCVQWEGKKVVSKQLAHNRVGKHGKGPQHFFQMSSVTLISVLPTFPTRVNRLVNITNAWYVFGIQTMSVKRCMVFPRKRLETDPNPADGWRPVEPCVTNRTKAR